MNNNLQGPSVHPHIPAQHLAGMRRGLEKESLRATNDGQLSKKRHPVALGSALTHPHITTDFSESQVELITGVSDRPQECIDELTRIQRFTLQTLEDEVLWVSSMPCELPPDDDIPLGQYGTSNVGRSKTVYRTGLGYRYGRRMQTISGIHYNWSVPGVSNDSYFGLIRNFRRHAFLLLYLFGASPAVCSGFVAGRDHPLQPLSSDTHYLPYATSLRMGRLGYQSDAQASLAVSYNSLHGYARSLQGALTQPYPAYEAIGVQGPDGGYRQLATSLLQIENEFYGTIRPKRVIRSGERPLHALRERGVEYVEVRLMDLDPFEPVGINPQTLRFLDVFLLHCLHSDSPPDTPAEIAAVGRNQHRVAERGREPGLTLERGETMIPLQVWGRELVEALVPIAAQLDNTHGGTEYSRAVAAALRGLDQPDTLPSARVLESIRNDYDGSFSRFVVARSRQTRDDMLATASSPDIQQAFEKESRDSWAEQAAIEAADTQAFDAYLRSYLAVENLTPA